MKKDVLTAAIAWAAISGLLMLTVLFTTHSHDTGADIGTALTCEQVAGVVVCIER